jgi:hypothetical protein
VKHSINGSITFKPEDSDPKAYMQSPKMTNKMSGPRFASFANEAPVVKNHILPKRLQIMRSTVIKDPSCHRGLDTEMSLVRPFRISAPSKIMPKINWEHVKLAFERGGMCKRLENVPLQ